MPISNQFAATIRLESEKCKNEDFPINRPNPFRRIREGSDFPLGSLDFDEKND